VPPWNTNTIGSGLSFPNFFGMRSRYSRFSPPTVTVRDSGLASEVGALSWAATSPTRVSIPATNATRLISFPPPPNAKLTDEASSVKRLVRCDFIPGMFLGAPI
jgi:hypothetical protein